MYINNELNYREIYTCKNCKNIDICRWCSDMKTKQDEVNKLQENKIFSPISINVDCRNFERKSTKRDDFSFIKNK